MATQTKNVIDYLNPDFVFIPFREGYKLKVENSHPVFKEGILQEGIHSFILSSISGEVIGAKKCIISDGSEVKCIAIANNFKEQPGKREAIKKKKKFSKVEIISLLKNKNGLSMTHYNKNLWDILFQAINANTLIVSSLELSDELLGNSYLMTHYQADILDTIDILIESFGFKSTTLVLPNTDTKNIATHHEYSGRYPKIKLKIMNSKYPMGLEHILIRELCGKNINKKDILFLSVADCYAIYNVLIRNKHITERLITIAGNMVQTPIIINAKIGALIEPAINEFVKLKNSKEENLVFITNEHLTGTAIPIDSLVVTHDLRGVIINQKKEVKSKSCINCGRCRNGCPEGLNPKFIMDNAKNPDKLIESKLENCIKCGLCTYNCPAKINLKPFLIKRFKDE